MKSIFILFFLIIFTNISAQQSQSFYYNQNQYGFTSPGALKFGLYGYDNPALLSTLNQFDLFFTWSDREGWGNFKNWGLFTAVPNLGFAAVHQTEGANNITDFKISGSLGSSAFSIGFGYGWSSGDLQFFNRSDLFTVGTLFRPVKYLSLGLIGNLSTMHNSEGAVDIAIRPFGNEFITFFGDYVFSRNMPASATNWSTGAVVEPIPGIRFSGRYFGLKDRPSAENFFNVGIQLSFGRAGLTAKSNYSDGKNINNIYGIRLGALDRNPFSKISDGKNYVKMDLNGTVKYQRNLLFDNSKTLYDIIAQIDAAKNDETISGIAINTSGMNINREMLWELRTKLLEFKKSTKKVIIFIDRVSIDGYHFASVADKIILDPQGMIMLEGYSAGRQYYKGTLEKIGIGFTELRYFKYKSAMESFSRESMSEADREQYQALVDDYYNLAKKEIISSGRITAEKYDDYINNVTLFLPGDAIKYGLVDSLGRWNKADEIINFVEKDEKNFIDAANLPEFHLPEDNYWGKKPEIAIVYAIGVCAMDEGIKARDLVKDIEAVTDNNNIKALVFRVDSPGGDALASDVVAEAIRKCSEVKPVIISQGRIAGSGGYWLSMYGDTIIAAPNTITGSIGVISGWYYDKEFKEKLGVSTDFVKRGEHADLGFGMTIPLINISIPDRDLTEEEKKKYAEAIKIFYNEFIQKVASGRSLSVEYVDSIGEGRFYSGEDGLNLKLVDLLGGLDKAIRIAEGKTGLKRNEYKIIQFPKPSLFDFNFLRRSFLGFETDEDIPLNHINFRLINNGIPMPLMPIDQTEIQ